MQKSNKTKTVLTIDSPSWAHGRPVQEIFWIHAHHWDPSGGIGLVIEV